MLISCYLTGHMLINMNMHKINYMQANHENVNDAVTREQQLIWMNQNRSKTLKN